MNKLMKNHGKKTIALFTALIYITVMGIGMHAMHWIFGYSYDNPEMLRVIAVVEIILTAIVIIVVKQFYGWKNIGFGKLQYKQLLWFIPHLLIISSMLLVLIDDIVKKSAVLSTSQWQLIAIICFGTFLVGFSEEVMFRGILLHSFTSKSSIFGAMFVSLIGFSLLHSVNVLGGMSVSAMVAQLFATAIFGFCFAPLALKLKNIWILIIFHWLWDFTLISSSVVGSDASDFGLFLLPLNFILGIVLWICMRKYTIKNK